MGRGIPSEPEATGGKGHFLHRFIGKSRTRGLPIIVSNQRFAIHDHTVLYIGSRRCQSR